MQPVPPCHDSSSSQPTGLLKAFKAIIDAQEFPWLPPWRRGQDKRERDVLHLRRIALRLIRQSTNLSRAKLALRSLAWPLLLPLKALQPALACTQPGLPRRFLRGAADLALHNIRADALGALRDTRPGNRHLARLYVPDRENQALLIHLNRDRAESAIGDKLAFVAFCRKHHIPHIPVLAHGQGATLLASPEEWPAADLFVKPTNLWGGQGAAVLEHVAAGEWRDAGGQLLHPHEFAAWAERHYGDAPWLIQPMLRVDPTWSDWSPGPLGTVRVVTVIVRPGESPELIAASMRLPRANMVVDNFSAGALSAEIDWRDGRLGPALGHGTFRRWHDRHPDTGAAITGARIPRWEEVCALACAAHAAAPGLVAVGWDITCRAGRPIVIEANPVFNLAPTVILGETRWLDAMQNRLASLDPKSGARPEL
jgi:hypothetical protein